MTSTEGRPAAADAGLEPISFEELQLSTRNHGMPLEALRYPTTPIGLHYLLIHYDIPAVEEARFALRVDGAVRAPFELTLTALRERPRRTAAVTFECAGNGRARLSPRAVSQPWIVEAVGTGEWSGTPLRPLLEEAGLEESVREILFTGLDHGVEGGVEQDYARSLPLAVALDDDVLLADSLNGAPLPPQHGFPLRLIVPGWYGMTNVKWLTRITALSEPFAGYQQVRGYRMRNDPDEVGVEVTRMAPRSLMVPPGVPDFLTRRRLLRAGPSTLAGRAWSGRGEIVRVEVSVDGGLAWADAVLGEPVGRHAWRGWSFAWEAKPGERELACRATDASGETQPLAGLWNVGGYANNAVQRVPVTIGDVF
jgi:DMSO/TMAO reductase YedYZ molybdopterin-dependent catalytic subunit